MGRVLEPLLLAQEYFVGARRVAALNIADVGDEGQLILVHLFKENPGFTLLLGIVRDVSDQADLELRRLLAYGKDDAESKRDHRRQDQGYD
jgi:hypothetical protein